VILHNLGFN